MKFFVIPAVQGLYVCSHLFAAPFWDSIYMYLILRWDLSPDQMWVLPLGLNLLVMAMGLPLLVVYFRDRWQARAISPNRNVACILGVVVSAVLIRGTVVGVYTLRENLAVAFSEFASEESERVVAAGIVREGVYTNELTGFRIELPEQWIVLSPNAFKRHQQAVAEGQGVEPEEAPSGFYNLLAVRRYPQSYEGFSPSMLLTAVRKSDQEELGIGSLRELMEEMDGLEPSLSERKFGETAGYQVHLQHPIPGGAFHQRILGIESTGYYLLVVAAYVESADYRSLNRSMRTLRIE